MVKRYNKKRPNYWKGVNKQIRAGMSDASKALVLAKHVKSLLNVEIKNHDTGLTQTAISSTFQVLELTNIAQGDTTLTRDGASLKLVGVNLKYKLSQHASATNTQVRMLLVHDTQTNQSTYGAVSLLADASIHDSIVSPRNLDNTRRFKVLMDRVHVFSSTNRTNSVHSFNRKLNIKIRYDNPAAAIGSITQSSLSLVLVSDEATNTPLITHIIRLRYVDN